MNKVAGELLTLLIFMLIAGFGRGFTSEAFAVLTCWFVYTLVDHLYEESKNGKEGRQS